MPKSKQKQSLPLIASNNIGVSQRILKDLKKKKTELITKYHPIGQIDDYTDNNEDNGSKFSMLGKVRSLNIQSAKMRVEGVRKLQGSLINASSSAEESNLDNVFVSSSKGADAYTLSIYNRAQRYTRP